MQDTRSEQFQKFSGEYFQRLVEGVAGVYGGKAADAVDLSPDDELKRWLQPTSPAALRALELGGTDEDAEKANQLWSHSMRGQQAMLRQQMAQAGATEPQVLEVLQQQGLTDEQIAQQCRKFAYELGKQNSHNRPKDEVAYHKHMRERAAKLRAQMMPMMEGSA